MGQPAKWPKREIVNAVFVCSGHWMPMTGSAFSLPALENTVHRYHVTWSGDGTWEKIVDRLREMVRVPQDRKPDLAGSVIDTRSVQGAATIDAASRGFDAAKKIPGRKDFGLVDTLSLLVAVVVVAANVSNNAGATATAGRARHKLVLPYTCRNMLVGATATAGRARHKCKCLENISHDSGSERTFTSHRAGIGLTAECVTRTSPDSFKILPHPLSR